MDIKVSVIVPVYNVEKTLSRCIDSILNQTMKDIEIILVDDGSTDSSGLICDKYVENYDFITVIHKENEGLGPTRNAGTLKAKGLYIYHCDSDDWIEPTLLEDSYNNAIAHDSDVVIFGYRMFTENNSELCEYGIVSGQSTFISGKNEVRQYFIDNLNNSYFTQSACNRLVRRDFLTNNNLLFKPYRRCQDIIFSIDLFDKLEKLSIIEDTYYNYIIEPGKFKGRSFDEMLNIYLDVFEALRDCFIRWDKFTDITENMLVRLYISQISNYSSYFIIRKAGKHKLKYINKLYADKRIKCLYKSIENSGWKSKFLKLTQYAINHNKKFMLFIVLMLHEIKTEVK